MTAAHADLASTGGRFRIPGVGPGLAVALARRRLPERVALVVRTPSVARSLLATGALEKRRVVDIVADTVPLSATAEHLLLRDSVFFADGDQHRRLRQLVDAFLTSVPQERLDRCVEASLDIVVQRWRAGEPSAGRFCALAGSEFASRVGCTLIGIPERDRSLSVEIAHLFAACMNLRGDRATVVASVEQLTNQAEACAERLLVDAATNEGFAPSLRSALTSGEVTRGEAYANLFFLVTASFETTAALLVGATLAQQQLDVLAREEPAWAALGTDGIDRLAIDAALGEVAPAQCVLYAATADLVTADGTVLRAGDQVLVLLGLASYGTLDEAVVRSDPSALAGHGRHAFGLGPHRCPGSGVARAEATALLTAIRAGRFGDFELDPEHVRWERGAVVRCPIGRDDG